MDELLLGVDIGSSSSKGVLVRPDGTIVAVAQRPHQLSLPRPGWAEHDAESVWWADFTGIARELTAEARRVNGRIAGLGVSGIGPCILPVDASGTPLRPAILYGIDTRATEQVAALTARFGADAILSRGGTALSSQASGPKLAWLREREPATWARTARFHMAHSFVVERLTGEYVLDHHSASQVDPLYDMTAAAWAADWADEVAPGIAFPRLAWSEEAVGRVHAAGEAASGIPEGTPVVAGTIDAWAEALSAGVRSPGDAMLMYGTTMFMVEVTSGFRPDARVWTTQGALTGTVTYAAGLSVSGGLTAWLREMVERPFEALVAEAGATPPGSDGLVVLPFFGAARSPIHDPDARGVILGLTLSHGRGHVYRALLEGAAYEVRHNLEVLAAAGASPSTLVAVGGGTKGGLWTQIVSDVTGQAQVIPEQTIGASYGDAWLAGVGAGVVTPDAAWNRPAETVVPYAAARARYDALYGVYRALYPATRDLVHEAGRVGADPG